MKQIYITLLCRCLPTLFLLQLLADPVQAQYVIKAADQQYELFNYDKAIGLYRQAYQKKPSLHAAERLASAYRLIKSYREAEKWYTIVLEKPGYSAHDIYYYALALQHNSKYTEAREQYLRYAGINSQVTSDQRNNWVASCDSAEKWMMHPKAVVVRNELALNSWQSDWGAVPYQGGIVFSSDRADFSTERKSLKSFLKFDAARFPDQRVYGRTGNSYLSLYELKKGSSEISHFSLPVKTNYHLASPSFSQDGKEVYFTLIRIPEKLTYKDDISTVNIAIYSARKDEQGNWSASIPFKYNKTAEYSVGDPFLSKNGRLLYFVSNMLDGKGGTDIFFCRKTEDGSWGTPVNASSVNTSGNERCPFLDQDGNFYFSSDGHIGMGGLDIFSAKTEGDDFLDIENIGYPINSSQDDFSYVLIEGGKGYFSSNRLGGAGSDEIYHFEFKQRPSIGLEALANKSGTSELLSLKVQTGPDGEERNVNNEPIGLKKAIRFKNIYYDFDKSNIRPFSSKTLDAIVELMKKDSSMWLELASHSDSRGSSVYNLKLSQRRADLVGQYLIHQGIDKDRITATGYGETFLLNSCKDGRKCTEVKHQLNRRTEFKILKF